MVDDLPTNASRNSEQTQTSSLQCLPSSFTNHKTQLQDWSMVVFPPTNHENLQIPSQPHQHDQIPESPSSSPSSFLLPSFSPTDAVSSSSPFDSQVQKGGNFVNLIRIGVEILRSKLFAMATSLRNYTAKTGAVRSIWPTATAVVISWWIIMRVWCWLRRRRLSRNENRLMKIIEEKDRKIAQLLHQIAQMNEMLIARHKALAAKLVE